MLGMSVGIILGRSDGTPLGISDGISDGTMLCTSLVISLGRSDESYDKLETERLRAALDDDSVSYGSSSDSDSNS